MQGLSSAEGVRFGAGLVSNDLKMAATTPPSYAPVLWADSCVTYVRVTIAGMDCHQWLAADDSSGVGSTLLEAKPATIARHGPLFLPGMRVGSVGMHATASPLKLRAGARTPPYMPAPHRTCQAIYCSDQSPTTLAFNVT